VPVPGDGRYEWGGYLPIRALPHAVNPDQGFWVTANNYMFPPGYQYSQAQHWTAADPFRASRATELLAEHRPHTVADMTRMQNDDLSLPSRALVPLLRGVRLTDDAVSRARAQLTGWDHVLDKDSPAAAIYEMFQRRVLANMREQFVPKEAREFISLSMSKVIEWLEAPDGRFGDDPIAGRDAVLSRSLQEAVAELTRRFGADMNAWRYGDDRFHYARIRHLLSSVVSDKTRAQLEAGPAPRGGDSYTLTATGGGDNQTSGGSFKFVADLSNWDHSLGLNNPGQSGDPRSPHYRDLFELWAEGRYFPVMYSRAKVESVAGERLTLQPAGGTR
jgi:penicillin amidase